MYSSSEPLSEDEVAVLRAFEDPLDIPRAVTGSLDPYKAFALAERGYMVRVKAGRFSGYHLSQLGKGALGVLGNDE